LTEIAKSPSAPLTRDGHVHGAHSARGTRRVANKN
jgi:hypothetical protein